MDVELVLPDGKMTRIGGRGGGGGATRPRGANHGRSGELLQHDESCLFSVIFSGRFGFL